MQAPLSINKHQPPIQVNTHLVTFCTVAVFLYALTRLWIGAKISAYFEAAFLLPFYYVVFKNWRYFKNQYLTWLVISMLAVPVLQFCVQYYLDPVLAMKYQGVDKLFRLTFFLAPAFWLAHNLNIIPWFIATNLIGFYILLGLQENPIESILTMHERWRNIFKGLHHEFMATYAGIALISAVFLFTTLSRAKKKLSLTIGLILFTSVVLCLLFIAFSQTRAIILGLATGTIFTAFLFRKNKVILITSTISFFIILSITLSSNIANRIEKEAIAFSDYLMGERTIPKDNTGYRILSWKIGLQHITDNLFIGLGGEANEDAMINSPEADKYMKSNLHHFHNSVIEFGIAYGLFGALIIGISILLLYKYIKAPYIPPRILSYSGSLLVFLYIINIFESYFFYWQGGYLLTWAISPIAAFIYYSNLSLNQYQSN